MPRKYTEIAFTDQVQQTQERYGSRQQAARMEGLELDDQNLGVREQDHIENRDSFYMASVSESGWPYVQFRGGPMGFLRLLDSRTLGYADFRGNLQYISVGNLGREDRVSLFLMDYPNRTRLKIFARAEVLDAAGHPDLVAKLEDPSYRARIERVILFHVEAFDWNCPQHITPRWTEQELP